MKRNMIAFSVLSAVFMNTSAFAADVETGTLTINGLVTSAPCTFDGGAKSVEINMPTVPASVFDALGIYAPYNDAVGVTSSQLIINCQGDAKNVKLSLITDKKITGNDKAVASSNDTVGYYLYLGNSTTEVDISKPLDLDAYKTADGKYAIPFKAKYLKLTSGAVAAGTVNSTMVMRVSED
ncbi:fimbrial protein [Superficieibacter sp.]|uniref:fimbrial protein n=1 Tax=Superficieibacter sp. TaxID=2303322 RepID=UPI0028A93D97|nr:fimbrial protein [Superficieibacter sp.]